MGETATFQANERIPTRPLSYDRRDLAMPKELVVDYNLGRIYINREDGVLDDFTNTVAKEVAEDSDLPNDVKVTYEDAEGHEVTKSITELTQSLSDEIKANITSISSINLITADSATSKTQISAAINDPYLNLCIDDNVKNSAQLKGSGATSITTSEDGKTITISSSDTTYSAGTGLSLNSGTFSLDDSGVTAGSYGNSEDVSDSSFKVPYITVDTYGRLTAASDKTITVPVTHYIANLYTANSDSSKTQVTAETSNPYLNLVENDTIRNSIRINGSTNVTVKSSADGKTINISATDTTYSAFGVATASAAGTAGLVPAPAKNTMNSVLTGGGWAATIAASILPTSGVTAGNYSESANKNLTYGGTFNIPYITVDSYGRITAASNKTMTMPAAYSHPTYTAKSSGFYKVTVDGTGHVSAATAVAKADITALGITTTVSKSLSTGGWSASGDAYVQSITVSGVTTNTVPIIDLVSSTTPSTAQTECDQWCKIYKAETGANTIKFYAFSAPTVALNIQIQYI